jgi:hypothetical protein
VSSTFAISSLSANPLQARLGRLLALDALGGDERGEQGRGEQEGSAGNEAARTDVVMVVLQRSV